MPTIACPLLGCQSEHELKHARNKAGTAFVSCDTWGSSIIWFRSPTAQEFLNANNGGGIRANPSPRIRKANPGPATEEVDDFRCERCARVDHKIVPLERGMTECPECHEPIEWPSEESDDHVDPDLGI